VRAVNGSQLASSVVRIVLRTVLIAAITVLQGCAFTQLREDLSEFYANPEGVAAQVVAQAALLVSGLDAPGLAETYGRKGLWQPLSFVKEKRGGVYLLEAYDPGKVPVLFIHGAGGTPQDWRYFIKHLDRSRYQAWVYYYPTGLPIDLSAAWLNNFIADLHSRYGFARLAIAAHSMGGLVARRFLALNQGAGHDYATLLATFSTPFGGVPAARLGLTLGAYAVPSWRDLAPDSAFLRALQSQQLPASVRHHVFFGYREDGADFDSDGVISVASQREQHIAASAARVRGFRTDHSDILDNPGVFKSFAATLAGFD
jgi:pimeloyl-ACP methyl ester carboxylesterase